MYKVNWNLSVQKFGLYVWFDLHFTIQYALSTTGTGGWWTHEGWQAWDPFYRVYAIQLLTKKKKKYLLLKYPTPWSASRNSERFLGDSGDIHTRTWLAP